MNARAKYVEVWMGTPPWGAKRGSAPLTMAEAVARVCAESAGPWWRLGRWTKTGRAERHRCVGTVLMLELRVDLLEAPDRIERRSWKPGELAGLFEKSPSRFLCIHMLRSVILRVLGEGPIPAAAEPGADWGPLELGAAWLVDQARALGAEPSSLGVAPESPYLECARLLNQELAQGALGRIVSELDGGALRAMELGGPSLNRKGSRSL